MRPPSREYATPVSCFIVFLISHSLSTSQKISLNSVFKMTYFVYGTLNLSSINQFLESHLRPQSLFSITTLHFGQWVRGPQCRPTQLTRTTIAAAPAAAL